MSYCVSPRYPNFPSQTRRSCQRKTKLHHIIVKSVVVVASSSHTRISGKGDDESILACSFLKKTNKNFIIGDQPKHTNSTV